MSTPDLIIEPASFWMVWTKTGNKPRYVHSTLEAATAEAERLARLNPGKKFIVLQSVAKLHVEAVPAEQAEAVS